MFGTEGMDNNHPIEVEVRLQAPNEYRVQIEQAGKVINAMELKSDAAMDAKARVSQFMAQVQNLILSSGSEVQLSARVIPNPAVEYGEMISILDILKGYGVSSLAVIPVR
jgi:biopolymer transport protein ExbD